MQRILIVTGVLGLGTAMVFGAAALTATLFPNGTMVNGNANNVVFDKGFGGGGVVIQPPVVVQPIFKGSDGTTIFATAAPAETPSN